MRRRLIRPRVGAEAGARMDSWADDGSSPDRCTDETAVKGLDHANKEKKKKTPLK